MKVMTCRQPGGACEKEFHADTFEEIAELSRRHGMEKRQEQDPEHLKAMQKMREFMKDPEEMKRWFESRRQEFTP